MLSETYLKVVLNQGTLDPATQELLLSAAESGKHPWLPGELWEKRDQLSTQSLERYLTARVLPQAYLARPEVAESEEVHAHPQRAQLLRAFREALSESTNGKRFLTVGLGGRRLQNLITGVLAAPAVADELSELVNWYPKALSESELHHHPDALALMEHVLSHATPESADQVAAELLMVMGAVEDDPESETLHRTLLAHPGSTKVLAGQPDLVSRRALERSERGSALVKDVLFEIEDGDDDRFRYSALLAQTDEAVAKEVTRSLEWAAVEKYAWGEELTNLQVRVMGYVAKELSGNPAAQEVLWALSDQWTGSVGDLVTTAVETSRRRRDP